MKEHKILEGAFTWVPMDKRTDRLGLPVAPRKPDLRRPILWIARKDSEVYLVNASDETLDVVTADSGGVLTVDDDVLPLANKSLYHYVGVVPGAAVKVEEYHENYDSDYILGLYLRVQSKGLGCIEIAPGLKKGGIGETVLLWDSGEVGHSVSIKPCASDSIGEQ